MFNELIKTGIIPFIYKWRGHLLCRLDFPGVLDAQESVSNVGDLGSMPGLGRSPGEGQGKPLQHSCLEHSMDRSMWQVVFYKGQDSKYFWVWGLCSLSSLSLSLLIPDTTHLWHKQPQMMYKWMCLCSKTALFIKRSRGQICFMGSNCQLLIKSVISWWIVDSISGTRSQIL